MFELAAEWRRFHSPGRARALHEALQRRAAYAEDQRNAQHAFVADEAHLEPGVSVDRRDQRDEALNGEEDVANTLARRAEHCAEGQLDLLAACKQVLTVLTGQRRDQMVLRGGRRRLWHGDSPVRRAEDAIPIAQYDRRTHALICSVDHG